MYIIAIWICQQGKVLVMGLDCLNEVYEMLKKDFLSWVMVWRCELRKYVIGPRILEKEQVTKETYKGLLSTVRFQNF